MRKSIESLIAKNSPIASERNLSVFATITSMLTELASEGIVNAITRISYKSAKSILLSSLQRQLQIAREALGTLSLFHSLGEQRMEHKNLL